MIAQLNGHDNGWLHVMDPEQTTRHGRWAFISKKLNIVIAMRCERHKMIYDVV